MRRHVDRAPDSRHALFMSDAPLDGLTLLSFESRRATEIAQLISGYGGETISAPSMREIPMVESPEVVDFFERLAGGTIDIVVFLTGVGTKALADVLRPRCSPERFCALLDRPTVVARGPKPRAALRTLGRSPDHIVPEPNTWRELLGLLESECAPLDGTTIAIQEYGRSNPDLIDALRARGATVLPVPVYRWALPEDLGPLRDGIRALVRGDADVILFTSAQQCAHVLTVARELGVERDLRAAFGRVAVASVGPIASEALRAEGFTVDIEPVKPKMGPLVREIAERAAAIVRDKRAVGGDPRPC